MTIAYTLTPMPGYLLLTATGGYEREEDLISYTRAFVEELKRLAPPAVIIDHRALSGSLKDLDPVKIASVFGSSIKELHDTRIAVVTRPERLSAVKFLENIAQNQGIIGMGFDSIDDAVAWLGRYPLSP